MSSSPIAFSNFGLRTKVLSIMSLGILLVAGTLIIQMFSQASLAERSTQVLVSSGKNVIEINKINILFKSEVQAWKDVLIRGADPASFAKYSKELESNSAKIVDEVQTLEKNLDAPGAELASKFLKAQQTLTAQYLEAEAKYLISGHFDQGGADRALKGLDRPVLESLKELSGRLEQNMDNTSVETLAKIHSGLNLGCLISAAFTLVALGLAWWLISSITSLLMGISDKMSGAAASFSESSARLQASGRSMSTGVTESAASLEEITSSIENVSGMVERNSTSAKQSQTASASGREIAQLGKDAISEVSASMREIQDSNHNVAEQMRASNEEFQRILEVIGEIGNKTKVINDIVFQTKLLSFNASVEAARAGEHGKGFAVVAEEVGNLAQMSGNSSREISALLESSIQQVRQIVENNQSRVTSVITEGQESVRRGAEKVERCGQILDQILVSVQSINSMMGGIAAASEEQAAGTKEIANALNGLNQVTNINSGAAQETASLGDQLHESAQDLNSLVDQLLAAVKGGQARSASRPASPDVSSAKPLRGHETSRAA